jgi:hypothetical protein
VSRNDASLFETKVTAATLSRTSDNDMINEVELQNPASLIDRPLRRRSASDGLGPPLCRMRHKWVIVLCGARSYVQRAGEAPLFGPFYQTGLIHLLRITAAWMASFNGLLGHQAPWPSPQAEKDRGNGRREVP